MALTRLDCDIFRGEDAAPEASAFVALNPLLKPAQLVFAGSTAVIQGVGSQVAYRLALDYFTQGILAFHDERDPSPDLNEDSVVSALEAAFRSANSSVYSFGHKLAAGGRMAASLLSFVIEGSTLGAARVGQGTIYLFRDNQLFPLFTNEGIDRSVMGDLPEFSGELAAQRQGFIGSHSIIDVEIASVSLQAGDTVAAFSRPLTTMNETLLFQHLQVAFGEDLAHPQPLHQAEQMCIDVFTQPETLSFAALASLGPEAIFCSKVIP